MHTSLWIYLRVFKIVHSFRGALRQAGADKRFGFANSILGSDFVYRFGLWVNPSSIEVVERDESL
jgi:hypothetical protein